jgi:MFS family permease
LGSIDNRIGFRAIEYFTGGCGNRYIGGSTGNPWRDHEHAFYEQLLDNAHQHYNRGEYAALYTMSWSAAQVFAPALGSQVIYYGGFKSLWWLLGILTALTAGGYYLLYKSNKTAIETVAAEEIAALPEQLP